MADIVIRGMDIPIDGRKHTALLQFLEDGKCRAIVEYSKSYDDRSVKVFEAVPLPEGHGRLIDADAIKKYWQECEEKLGPKNTLDLLTYHDVLTEAVIYDLDKAPTIVQAEGGTGDD